MKSRHLFLYDSPREWQNNCTDYNSFQCWSSIFFGDCSQDEAYPFSYPERVLPSGGWPSTNGTGTAVHVELAKFVASLAKCEPMIYEIYGQATSLIHSAQDGDLESLLYVGSRRKGSTSLFIECCQKSSSQGPSQNGSAGKKCIRRPREKAFFSSKTPEQSTPAATAFPKISPTLERQRKSLPAAKARDDILSVMKQADEGGRVVIVTGETGMLLPSLLFSLVTVS
jgi:hypothetical protein